MQLGIFAPDPEGDPPPQATGKSRTQAKRLAAVPQTRTGAGDAEAIPTLDLFVSESRVGAENETETEAMPPVQIAQAVADRLAELAAVESGVESGVPLLLWWIALWGVTLLAQVRQLQQDIPETWLCLSCGCAIAVVGLDAYRCGNPACSPESGGWRVQPDWLKAKVQGGRS